MGHIRHKRRLAGALVSVAATGLALVAAAPGAAESIRR
jgi:hypothetical protein